MSLVIRVALCGTLVACTMWVSWALEPMIHWSLPHRLVGLRSTRVTYFVLVAGVALCAFALVFRSQFRFTNHVIAICILVTSLCASIQMFTRYVWSTPWFADDNCATAIREVNVTRCYGDSTSRFRPFQYYTVFEGTALSPLTTSGGAVAFANEWCSCDRTDEWAVRTVTDVSCDELDALMVLEVDGEASCAVCHCLGNYDDLKLVKVGENGTVAGFQGTSIPLNRAVECVRRTPECFAYVPPRWDGNPAGTP